MTFLKKNKKKGVLPSITLFKNFFRQKKYENMTKFVAKLSFLKKNIMYIKLQKFQLKRTNFFLAAKLKKQFIKIKLDLFFIKNYAIF